MDFASKSGQLNCAAWAAASSVDTDLSFLSFFELYRTDVAQRRMTPPGVVEALDVVEHIRPGLLAIAIELPGNALQSFKPAAAPISEFSMGLLVCEIPRSKEGGQP